MVTVHIGRAVMGVRRFQDDVMNAIHIGDAHLAIGVHITLQHINFLGEIAGIVRTAVDMGTRCVNIVFIISCTLATNQRDATIEHSP